MARQLQQQRTYTDIQCTSTLTPHTRARAHMTNVSLASHLLVILVVLYAVVCAYLCACARVLCVSMCACVT